MFSSVVKHSFTWVLLAMVALFDLELEQLNVKTAFPYGKLEERIYTCTSWMVSLLKVKKTMCAY